MHRNRNRARWRGWSLAIGNGVPAGAVLDRSGDVVRDRAGAAIIVRV